MILKKADPLIKFNFIIFCKKKKTTYCLKREQICSRLVFCLNRSDVFALVNNTCLVLFGMLKCFSDIEKKADPLMKPCEFSL